MEEIRSLQGVPTKKSSKFREVNKVDTCDRASKSHQNTGDVIEFSDEKFREWPDVRGTHEEKGSGSGRKKFRKWEVEIPEEP
jgi:hypothetical protein